MSRSTQRRRTQTNRRRMLPPADTGLTPWAQGWLRSTTAAPNQGRPRVAPRCPRGPAVPRAVSTRLRLRGAAATRAATLRQADKSSNQDLLVSPGRGPGPSTSGCAKMQPDASARVPESRPACGRSSQHSASQTGCSTTALSTGAVLGLCCRAQ